MYERRWIIRDEPFNDYVAFLLRVGHPDDGEYQIGRTEITLEVHKTGELVQPTFSVTRDEAQQMMNGLWQAGLRPRDGSGSLAHVEAQKAHLEDMRRLVFKEGNSHD